MSLSVGAKKNKKIKQQNKSMNETFLVSDESINSYGFKVLTAGIDTTDFEKNPIMLYMHERKNNVIGRWENLKKENGKMYADAIFDTADPTAELIAGKVERGFIKSASIGIEVVEQDGDIVTKSRLFEISIVDMGSNKNALKLYNKKEIKKLFLTLNINQMNLLEALIKLLGLPNEATEEDVIKEVERLQKTETEAKKVTDETAKALVDNAIRLEAIKPTQRENFLKLFKTDFGTTKDTLISLMGSTELDTSKNKMLADFVNGVKRTATKTGIKHDKPKSDWTLTDYRKQAPNELRDNPDLYKELVNKTYSK